MKRLGISIYPEIVGIEKTIKYIEVAAKNGFQRIFANLIAVKNNQTGRKRLQEISKVYKQALKLGFDVILDVNPQFYKEFKLPNDEIKFFINLGASGVRLDLDFGGDVESWISQNNSNFKVELNSSIGIQTLRKTLAKGGNKKNIIACHNFYPLSLTGLSKDKFVELSTRYNDLGIKVAAFITLPQNSKGVGPWNVNDGMPTLEEHRHLSINDQLFDMLAYNFIQDIIISQQGDIKYLEAVKIAFDNYLKLDKEKEITFTIANLNANKVESNIIFDQQKYSHYNRPDANDYFIRSSMPRIYYKDKDVVENNAGKKLKFGDIVILNNKMKRYKGELHIIIKPIDDSINRCRNLVGNIKESDYYKLRLLGSKRFKFKM